MKSEQILKEKVLKEIEKLPEEHLIEVRNLADSLLKRKRKAKEAHSDLNKDPIMELFGIADVKPFSHKIDSDVYGD